MKIIVTGETVEVHDLPPDMAARDLAALVATLVTAGQRPVGRVRKCDAPPAEHYTDGAVIDMTERRMRVG
jgi:hypothetical protein